MNGDFALLRSEFEDSHHIEQSADRSDAVVIPTEVVMEYAVVHEQLRVVGEA